MPEKGKSLAGQKWFVPLILLLLAIIAVSSMLEPRAAEAEVLTEEQRLEEMCNAILGVSDAKVMITYRTASVSAFFSEHTTENEILGIAVLCKGGDAPDVQLAIHKMLETLFQLPSTRITVSAKK